MVRSPVRLSSRPKPHHRSTQRLPLDFPRGLELVERSKRSAFSSLQHFQERLHSHPGWGLRVGQGIRHVGLDKKTWNPDLFLNGLGQVSLAHGEAFATAVLMEDEAVQFELHQVAEKGVDPLVNTV